MTLKELTLWGERDKVAISIERLKSFEPPEGYYLAFSGGKDSCTIKALADMAGVKYDAHYNLTTVDPPELVRFIREQHPDVAIDKPERSMWELIVWKQSPPTRWMRYCCEYLKERGGDGRIVLTGIRAEESARRAKRQMVESCFKSQKRFVHPVIDWTERDVWQFIHENRLPYCGLYDEGFKRIGCIMCPYGHKTHMLEQARRWPKYYDAYVRAFAKMIEQPKRTGASWLWQTGQEVMDWWLNDAPGIPDEQLGMFVDGVA